MPAWPFDTNRSLVNRWVHVDRSRPFLDRHRAAFTRIGLPVWFFWWSALLTHAAIRENALALDGFVYQRAANAWLSGLDPWSIDVRGIYFSAAPTALMFYVPTSLLPEVLSGWLWFGAVLAGGFALIRALRLPGWWIFFPPLWHAILVANVQPIVVWLLLSRFPVASAAAVLLKAYAALPALFVSSRRFVIYVVAATALTFPLLPWSTFLTNFREITELARLQYSPVATATSFLPLLPPTLLALWVLRERGAGWWTVPTLLPATQLHYSIFAMPALFSPWVAAALAIPNLIPPAVVLVSYAAWLWWTGRHDTNWEPRASADPA